MIFSELYSAYYNTVAKIIKEIICDNANEKSIYKIIEQYAFDESILNILPAIKEEKWQVITKNFSTPIKHIPTIPLTTLQKMWLKAILMDERVKLFDINVEGLDGVEPLFTKDDYQIYDRYSDGDNFCDEEYIKKFKTILYAFHNNLPLKAEMVNRKGNIVHAKFIPQKIEYSEKDDKFRVLTKGNRFVTTINIARITKCDLYCGKFSCKQSCSQTLHRATITMIVKNERNALERAMLHFAHFEKRVEKINNGKYKVVINYDSDDTPEMVIRVLAFGPLVEVVEPTDFRELIKNKLKKQLSCGLK